MPSQVGSQTILLANSEVSLWRFGRHLTSHLSTWVSSKAPQETWRLALASSASAICASSCSFWPRRSLACATNFDWLIRTRILLWTWLPLEFSYQFISIYRSSIIVSSYHCCKNDSWHTGSSHCRSWYLLKNGIPRFGSKTTQQKLNNGSNIIKPWALAHGFMILEPLFK